TEILPGDKNTCARIARLIERKCGIKLSVRGVPPIVKQKFAEARTLDPFQKLLGNNLIGVDVRPLKRRDLPFVSSNWSHVPSAFDSLADEGARATRAAARKSSSRELVQDPMHTRSTAIF